MEFFFLCGENVLNMIGKRGDWNVGFWFLELRGSIFFESKNMKLMTSCFSSWN